ncbi:MAG: hypothetical protein U0531_20080 [Dehalococcoidia bacterium]
MHGGSKRPRESLVRVVKAEDGGYDGQQARLPAREGLRLGYESETMKRYLAGGFSEGGGKKGRPAAGSTEEYDARRR